MQFHSATDQHLSTQFYIPGVVTVIQTKNYVGLYRSESITF